MYINSTAIVTPRNHPSDFVSSGVFNEWKEGKNSCSFHSLPLSDKTCFELKNHFRDPSYKLSVDQHKPVHTTWRTSKKASLCFLFRSEIGKTVKRNEPRLKTALLTKKRYKNPLHRPSQNRTNASKRQHFGHSLSISVFHGNSCRQSI